MVDYLNEGNFENRKDQKILHLDALCEMMQAITGDIRFTEMMETLKQKQEESGEAKMCEYFDMLEAIGEERGKGIGENRLAELIQILLKEQKLGDIALASSDSTKRHELYHAYGI